MRNSILSATLTTVLAAGLAACGGDEAAPAGGGGKAPPAATGSLPAGLLLAASPGEAVDVGALKATAKEGDTVVVRGRIGGVPPFIAGIAAMTIADRKLVPCSEMSMEDGCKTPWDYCCAPQDELTANTATVQVVGADGRPLRADLTAAGLAPLSTVVVTGKVGPRPDPKVLVIDAVGIFVEKK